MQQEEEETFDKWRERQFEDLGADGSNFTRGPKYTPAAGGNVEVYKCSLNFKLQCPLQARLVYTPQVGSNPNTTVLEVKNEHEHNFDHDNSKALPLFVKIALKPYVENPQKKVRCRNIWQENEWNLTFPSTKRHKNQVSAASIP